MDRLVTIPAFTVLLTFLAGATPAARAQEAVFTDSATQPSPGVSLLRQQVRFTNYSGDDGRRVDDTELWTSLSLGLRHDLALTLTAPVMYRSDNVAGDTFGPADLTALLKYRVYQYDFGPIETVRLSLLGGVQFPTGRDAFSSDSVDPVAGAALTAIYGRHGGNLAARYRLDTGSRPDDLEARVVRAGMAGYDTLTVDAAYLYRLYPATYTRDTRGAWYAVLESNNVYETNGDVELLLAPGVMYEASRFVLEAAVRFPAYQNLDDRLDTRFSVAVGFRYLF